MKKLTLSIIFILLLLPNAFGYETNVHEKITEKAITFSNIESYLKSNINISLMTKFNGQFAIEWLKLGSKWEDNDFALRWLNHFYDPTIGKGLNPCVTTLCSPSLQWGKDSSENAWSWKWARDSYYKALTDFNPKYRETYFSYVFRALGQVIHLVHDLAVPAHVRNDPHGAPIIKYDLYEEYTRDRANSLSYSGYPPVDIKTFNILDKFWVNSGYGLSEYTNTNFFSRDTIFKNYPHPARENTNFSDFGLLPITVITTPGNINHNTFYISGYGKRYLAGMKYLAEEIWGLPIPFKYQLSLILDDRCHEEYAQHLIPRAVGYSAGLLNYFFRGEIDMIPDNATGSGHVIVNNTDEDMNGIFELWYDNKSDQRVKAWSASLSIGKKSSGNNKSTNISFTPPIDAKEDNKYMLVFRGKLGNEENAVIGRIFELKETEYLFLTNLNNQTVVFEIKASNNQYQLIPASKNINSSTFDMPSTMLTIQSHPNKKEHMVALPWYSLNPDGSIARTTYDPDIRWYGGMYEDWAWQDMWGNPIQVVRGFPQAYIPRDFEEGIPYVWDSGLIYGEWISEKVGYYYDFRLASYIHGRRPFEVVNNKLTAKNISIRKSDGYTYYGDDYYPPLHIQYKNEDNIWVKSQDLTIETDRGYAVDIPVAVLSKNKIILSKTIRDWGKSAQLNFGDVLLHTTPPATEYNTFPITDDWIFEHGCAEYGLYEWGEGGETGTPPGDLIYEGSGGYGYTFYYIYVNDFDNTNEDNTFICFFSKLESKRNVTHDFEIYNDGGFCYIDYFNSSDNYYSTTKYYLATRYNGSTVIKTELATLKSVLENYLNPTLYPTLSGTRISGQSSQINDRNIVYTYIIERPERVDDKEEWVFVKRIIGIINIADNVLPIGYREEFELDFSGTDFDPSWLAAIGVSR